jgi:serine/threonine-protein kinase RsbT
MVNVPAEIQALQTSQDVVVVRQIVRQKTTEMGFSLVGQTKLITAASELARNTIEHGRGGQVRIEQLQNGHRAGLRLVFEDSGPGIVDIRQALTDGYTSGNGLGLGLGGSRRLVHEFEIESQPGQGTRVTVVAWK